MDASWPYPRLATRRLVDSGRGDKGAVLQLEGRQIGLIANLDLSGLAIALR
jgi:hypothetical protein